MFLIPRMIYVMFKNMNNIKNISFAIIFFVFSTQSFADIIKVIEINGNKRISNETIEVLGNINKGEDLSKNQLNIILKNLYETNFFKDIKIEFNNRKLQAFDVGAGSAKLFYVLKVGKMDIVKFEIRYKGNFSSQPQFLGVFTNKFKALLK